jgi:predicted metal-dependent HD superfamily phosphohydrolase
MISPEKLDALQGQWVRLVARWNVPPTDAYPVFDQLVTAYSEPHRFYHNLEHVAEVLRVAGRLGASPEVLLAVWFHDAVYDPKATDNEESSALLANRLLSIELAVPVEIVVRVGKLVLATKHAVMNMASADAAMLLDADLAILGASETRYARYAADIRREYAHVPDEDYRRGRAAVLEAFLKRDRIYRTDVMFAEGEIAARRNLTSELAGLRGSGERGSP